MHPLNILNMWPIIYNKLIVAGAGPVHSCMCNRLLIQWQTFEILTMSSPQRQPKYAGSPTQQAEILHLPCLLTCFKISPIALFNRVASLNILLNSIVQTNMFQWHMHIIRMIMQYKPVFKKTRKKIDLIAWTTLFEIWEMISPISIIHVNLKNNEGIKFIISKLLVFKIPGHFNK